MAFQPGHRLAHYVVQGLLGAGGMGEVYAAEDTRLKRRVAIKVLPDALAQDESRRARFEREAQSVAALNHPNIVTLYAVEHAGDTTFLVMELVEGRSMSEVIGRSAMSLATFFSIAIPVADGIAAAHQKGITHRDLKPGNIMVGPDGRAKVLDFGLAKLVADPTTSDVTVTREAGPATTGGMIVGTAAYMSPEQAEGKAVDARSDLFSLGIIFYEMLTGERPFKGDSNVSMLSSILRDTPVAITEVNPAVPRELWHIVRRCLAKDPEKRLQSAKDLRNELEEVRHAIDSGELAPPPPMSRGQGARIAKWWPVAALIVIGLAISMWPLLQSESRSAPITAASFRSLTTQAGVEEHPSLSPDGQWMVYSGDQDGNRDILLRSLGAQNAINLTKDFAGIDEQPSFSPDGERIAFRSGRDGGGVFVMGRTGDLVRKIASGGFNPSWSPDGKSIVFSSQTTGFNPGGRTQTNAALHIADVASGETRRLSVADGLQPKWSPDGQWIAFWGMPGSRNRELYVTRPDRGEPLRLTDHPAIDWNPVWAPAGDALYFGSDRGGLFGLWRLGFDRQSGKPVGDPVPVQLPAQMPGHFSVSADGSRLVFASNNAQHQVYAADLDAAGKASNHKPITLGARTWFYIDISHDGQRLSLVSRFPQEDVFVAAADGQGLRQITNDPAVDRGVRWSPDDSRILYYSGNVAQPLHVMTMAPDGSDQRRISPDLPSSATAWIVPQWSTDGRRVSALASGEVPQGFIFERSSDGPWRARPMAGAQRDFTPLLWLRDDSGLIGTLAPGGELAVYSIQAETVEPLGLTGFPPQVGMDWFPDGKRLLSIRNGNIVAIEIASRQETIVWAPDPRHVVGQPRVTTDGKRLYYLLTIPEADITLMTMKPE
jgi:eukaryotic-like serine/threonine-protein kinase